MQDLLESIKLALLRFFDGLFPERNSEVEFLRLELDKERSERIKLLNQLLEFVAPKPLIEEEPKQNFKPIMPRTVPWHIRKQMLEEQSKQRAQELKNINEAVEKDINDLETELGVK